MTEPTPDAALTRPPRPDRRELLGVLGLLAVAALLRLPGIAARGRWDADQGTEMLVLRALTQGTIPLLGPSTSIGEFHHGVLYYYLLAPAALLSHADPVAVTIELALLGIATVAATWWLARAVGGPLAGLVAALLVAVSPAAIEQSTFIWNPNPVALASAVAFGAAIRARQAANPRWWVVASLGAMLVVQFHVLGVVVLPPLAVLFLIDLGAARAAGRPTGPFAWAALGAVVVFVLGYVPLLVHELQSGFTETRALLDFLAGVGAGGTSAGSGGTTPGIIQRVLVIGLRTVTWPVAGLLTDHVVASLGVLAVAFGLIVVAIVRGPGRRVPDPARWLLATVAWSVVALAVASPGLAVITPGLPNDQYHSFLDPLVLTLVATGIARLARRAPTAVFARVLAGAATVILVAASVSAAPPAVADDGGWPLADAAAARVIETANGRPIALVGIPPFKPADAMAFPLERRGADVGPWPPAGDTTDPVLVIVCDPLFAEVVGAPCGGPVEGDWVSIYAPGYRVIDRFDAGSRRVISIYDRGGGVASR